MEDIQFKRNYSAFVNPNYAVTPAKTSEQKSSQTTSTNSDFRTLLQKQQLVFSKHALQRMDARQIQVSPQLLTQMNSAVEKARAKGIKDALILNGQTAFIVNIPSNTVVTTMSGQEMNNNVFTNIDGAVMI